MTLVITDSIMFVNNFSLRFRLNFFPLPKISLVREAKGTWVLFYDGVASVWSRQQTSYEQSLFFSQPSVKREKKWSENWRRGHIRFSLHARRTKKKIETACSLQ